MLRALFSGVSGLTNHLVKMDVIGNNIANVNTYGFKSARVTFAEALTQREGNALAPQGNNGGKNPMEIGLGSKISSIDNNFAQGNLLSTEITTDLAIQGEGFFVLSDGVNRYYTRAGGFQVDADGKLVAQGGLLHLQGRLADANGNIMSGSEITDLVIPFGEKEPAKATTNVQYFCNLSADSDAAQEIWTAQEAFSTNAKVAGGTAVTFPLTITTGGNDTFTIDLNGNSATVAIAQNTYASISDFISAINTAIGGTALAGQVVAEEDPTTAGAVRFKTTAFGSGNNLTLTEGNGALAIMGITSGSSGDSTLTAGTMLNDLNVTNSPLVAGTHYITISGTNPDGSEVNRTYNYVDGATVQDLLTEINSAFAGTTASLNSSGKIVMTDNVAGSSATTINLNTNADMTLPAFDNTIAGKDYGTHTASINVYDSLGKTHLLEVEFTKTADSNTWTWEATIDGGQITPSGGGSGAIVFNSDGSLASFTGGPIAFSPGGGSAPMSVDLNPGNPGSFSGITQFNSPSTTIAIDQDGYTMGNLENIAIAEDGKISGSFTNGVIRTMGQVALADFTNPGGLTKAGNNTFTESANSGDAVIGNAGVNFNSTINSGYLEMSNVDLTAEFTDLIVAQRGFQANARVIQTSDMILAEVNGLKR
jgi:flagellar hook protein FlgE